MKPKKLLQLFGLMLLCTVLTFTIAGAAPARSASGLHPVASGVKTPEAQQSTTGPTPPPEVLLQDSQKPDESDRQVASEVVISGVPAYIWRHGCGPTAVGMVVGYYDGLGFDDLVPGDASTQTDAVDQMIASGGDSSAPNPPGSEQHYEDYAYPQDYYPGSLLEDAYLTDGRTPHADDSLADFMDTSKSERDNYYGWSWSNDIAPSFENYVLAQNPAYITATRTYFMGFSLTWELLQNEIDAGRPMVFLVDSSGDGSTDHFVTVVGYRDTGTRQYAVWDTWFSTLRWEDFLPIASGTSWGVWGGWSLVVLDAMADAYEPDDNALEANLLEAGQPQTHGIGPVGDADWVHFTLAGESQVVLETAGTGGDDTRLWLYDSGLNEIEFNEDGGDGSYALIDRLCEGDSLPAGDYYARVEESGGDAEISAYTLSLSSSICLSPDAYEPDDDAAQAAPIQHLVSQTHSIFPEGDVDWVRFSVSEFSEVYLSTYGPEADDTFMTLYDANLEVLEENDDTPWSSFASIDRLCDEDPLPAGTYYVNVTASPSESVIALYNFSLYIVSCNLPTLHLPLIHRAGP